MFLSKMGSISDITKTDLHINLFIDRMCGCMETDSGGETRLQRAMLSHALQVCPLFTPEYLIHFYQSFGCFSCCEMFFSTLFPLIRSLWLSSW